MSREWVAGDVAMVMCGGKQVVAMRYNTGSEVGWRYQAAAGRAFTHSPPDKGTEPRRLVVIDPEDCEQVEALLALYVAPFGDYVTKARALHMQAALRSLVEPPKPKEPTVGGMVETRDGEEWFHANVPKAPWMNGNRWAFYSDLDVVRVIVPGVTP